MQTTISDTIPTPAAILPPQQLPLEHEPQAGNATGKNTARPHASSEDYVTLSSSRSGSGDPTTRKRQSQPVSNSEKQALLKPAAPQYGFSVYG